MLTMTNVNFKRRYSCLQWQTLTKKETGNIHIDKNITLHNDKVNLEKEF